MPREYKTAFQLEQIIADFTGLYVTAIHVTKVGNSGDFNATVVGTVAFVNASRAKSDIEVACRQLKQRFKLKA